MNPQVLDRAARNEEARIAVLLDLQILDSPSEAAFDAIVQAARRIFSCDTALISLVDKDRQWFKAKCGLNVNETPRKYAFCAYTILSDEALVIPDALLDARFSDNPLVTGPPYIRSYAGIPLRVTANAERSKSAIIGSLCVFDSHPVVHSEAQLSELTALAHVAEALIEARSTAARAIALAHELNEARRRAEGATAAKAAFLANMSHEIRTPMNGVLGFADLLLESNLEEEQHHYVQLIVDSGKAMMRLLNDILDMAKIDAGQMQIAADPIDIRHKVRSCVALMQPIVENKGVGLEIEISPDTPEIIITDGFRIRQILLNLLGNAIKFTAVGTVRLTLRVEKHAGAQNLVFDVIDTGVGIASDRLELIFEQFAQADTSISRKYGGTGLGLSISNELAKLLGGSIAVTSALGQGTKFTLSLPLIENVADDLGDSMPSLPPEAGDPEQPRRPRILIAEDHEINQLLMMALCRSVGLDATIACNGLEAIAMVKDADARGTGFDLVFMDMQMPEMGGIEATQNLRNAEFGAARLPIVALTANAYAEDMQACLDAGMQAHLSKPVRAQDLQSTVAKYVLQASLDSAPLRNDAQTGDGGRENNR